MEAEEVQLVRLGGKWGSSISKAKQTEIDS